MILRSKYFTINRLKPLIDSIRKKVNERGPKGVMKLEKMFNLGVKDKPHRVNREEFKQIWREFKIGFDESDLEVVFNELDKNHNSTINSDEFFMMLRVKIKLSQGTLNESRLKAIGLAFDMLDTNKSGTVELEVIKSKYNPQRHPAVLEGHKTEEQVREDFNDMLNSYTETYGTLYMLHALCTVPAMKMH